MNPPEEPRMEQGDSTMLMGTWVEEEKLEEEFDSPEEEFEEEFDSGEEELHSRVNYLLALGGWPMTRKKESDKIHSTPARRIRLSIANLGRHGSIMPPESTTIILKEIMTALTQPNIVIVGIYGTSNANRENAVEKVSRRVERDGLFNVVVKTNVMKRPDLKRIQGELWSALGLQLHDKILEERATRLCERIKMEGKILIIFDDLQSEINLAKIGIPFGNNHMGCKILLVAQNKEVLSNKMKLQIVFYVDKPDEEPTS